MAAPFISALVGSTGLVGSHILTALLSLPQPPTLHALTRRALPTSSPTLLSHINKDTTTWAPTLSSLSPTPSILLSALGTTRAAAGSFEAQYAIDHTLNVELATAAKKAGTSVYVLVSSAGTSLNSKVPYSHMKAETEAAVRDLGFEHVVILRPGLLVGKRQETRSAEGLLQGIARGLGALSQAYGKDWWAQDAEVVARAAVVAGVECVRGRREKGVWLVEQADIVRMGREEWAGWVTAQGELK